MFNRLLGNSDNELGAALHPTARHIFYTQGTNSFKTRDKDASILWKCNDIGFVVSVLLDRVLRDTTLQPGGERKASQRKRKGR